MTVNILTPGHIKCLDELSRKYDVVVGLLSSKALKGYKKELMPYKDRRFVLDMIVRNFWADVWVVKQDSLDPTTNIKKYNCFAIASGDGFEPVELEAIKKLKITPINIKLRGEVKKKYSSSKICKYS